MNIAIKLAIEKGGWLPKGYDPFVANPVSAEIKGDRLLLHGKPTDDGWDGGTANIKIENLNFYRIAQDPLFWQALGKALGWEEATDSEGLTISDWKGYAHQYFDLVLTGQPTEKFWQDLLT